MFSIPPLAEEGRDADCLRTAGCVAEEGCSNVLVIAGQVVAGDLYLGKCHNVVLRVAALSSRLIPHRYNRLDCLQLVQSVAHGSAVVDACLAMYPIARHQVVVIAVVGVDVVVAVTGRSQTGCQRRITFVAGPTEPAEVAGL